MKTISTPAGLFAATLLLAPALSWAGGTVNNCTEAELRAAMAGGGTVNFACDGTITLASTINIDTDVVLDGSGHAVTISGGNAVRVFYASAGTTLSLVHLTISGGRTPDGSNGIWTPQYPTPGGPGAPGGGLYNAGTLILRDCVVTANRTGDGGHGYSGAPGSFQYSAGGSGGPGGGIYNIGTLVVSNCIVSGNSTGNGGVSGVSGGYDLYSMTSGDGGFGAGIYNGGTLRLDNSTVCGNGTGNGAYTPTHNPGANGGAGGGIWSGGNFTASGCTFSGNSTGYGGRGGGGNRMGPAPTGGTGGAGGAICSTGSLALTNCTLAGNSTGQGGNGGYGTFAGGSGGSGGSGAGIDSQNNLFLLNCTVATNRAGSGGAGGYGTYGSGPPGPVGYGGGIGKGNGSAQLLNTIAASNRGNTNAPDVSGGFSSLGHNLIGATNGSSGFPIDGDLAGSSDAPLDPKLAPLANNGGPTLTMALLPGSPGIDTADPAAPATDQRGMTRPVGPAPDIGAFEYGLPAVLQITHSQGPGLDIRASGYPGYSGRLFVSSNFSDWVPIATNQIGTDGTVVFQDNCDPGTVCRFYRLIMP